jgi:predicted site-specific integrase-resolvase
MTPNPKPHISPRELAAALGLTKPTIIHWLNRGWIEHSVLPNGRRLIPVTELERLLPKAIRAQQDAPTEEPK